MTWSSVIPLMLPELLLIATACALFLLGVSNKASSRRMAALLSVGVLLIVFFAQLPRLGNAAPFGDDPSGQIRVAALAQFIKALASGVGALFVLLSWPTDEQATGNSALQFGADAAAEFFALLLLSIAGIFIVASANDLILLFLGIELASIPTYIMVSISRPKPAAQEAGVKYFFLGAMAAALMLFGFSYLYGATGMINLADLAAHFAKSPGNLTTWEMLGTVMLISGFAFKIAAVPLHFYAGDVYEGAATPVTALLSFVPKTSGFVALIKILYAITGGTWIAPHQIPQLLWVLALLTMTVGNVLGLLQQNVKRMLAYSSIAHTGYMLVGITALLDSHSPLALQSVLFYLASYGIMNVAAFGVLMLLPSRKLRPNGSAETIEDLAGAGKNHTGLGLAMAVACFSLTGLPLTIGFFGKFYLLRSAFSIDFWLGTFMLINAVIAAGYYLRIVATMFLRTESTIEVSNLVDRPVSKQVPILASVIISVSGTLLFGIVFPATDSLRDQAFRATQLDVRPLTMPTASAQR
jgi:NADH-quinone oxidoreductase subunit N